MSEKEPVTAPAPGMFGTILAVRESSFQNGELPLVYPNPFVSQKENEGSNRGTGLPQVREPVAELSQKGKAPDSQ